MALQIVMLVFGIIAILAGIVAVIMSFVKGYELTEKKVAVPGAICVVALVAFIITYTML